MPRRFATYLPQIEKLIIPLYIKAVKSHFNTSCFYFGVDFVFFVPYFGLAVISLHINKEC